MITQQNNFPRCERLGMKLNSMLRKSILAGIAAVLMGASLVFSESASAHEISTGIATGTVMAYAKRQIKESRNRYVEAITNCKRVFPGHNHYVRCTVQYVDQKSKGKAGVFACTENIEVFFQPHNRGEEHVYYMRHTSRECGGMRLVHESLTPRGSGRA